LKKLEKCTFVIIKHHTLKLLNSKNSKLLFTVKLKRKRNKNRKQKRRKGLNYNSAKRSRKPR